MRWVTAPCATHSMPWRKRWRTTVTRTGGITCRTCRSSTLTIFRALPNSGPLPTFQPAWAYADDYVVDLTLPFIKPEVAKWMYPIRSVADAGGRLAFGSDWSVSTADPFYQIEHAVTRVDAETHATDPLNPEQAITLEQAIEAFTMGSAFVNHQETKTGSIEVGKLADLIVIDQNLFKIEPQAISDTKVVLTLFGGKPVYGKPGDL